jgi:hypothetical protein
MSHFRQARGLIGGDLQKPGQYDLILPSRDFLKRIKHLPGVFSRLP